MEAFKRDPYSIRLSFNEFCWILKPSEPHLSNSDPVSLKLAVTNRLSLALKLRPGLRPLYLL
jgi:hypothetical protein